MNCLLQETLCSYQTKPYMQFLHHLLNGIKAVFDASKQEVLYIVLLNFIAMLR